MQEFLIENKSNAVINRKSGFGDVIEYTSDWLCTILLLFKTFVAKKQ